MSKYSNIKKLRLVSKRLIIDSSKKWKKGKINIITAGTGVGKTYNIRKTLIPSDIKEGINKFLFLTVHKDNVDQDYNDIRKDLRGKADVTKNVDEFLNADDDYPIVLVSTVALAVNGGTDQENDQIIYKDYVNVGIAVDTHRGLVVPVMKNADTMGIPEITRSLAEMAGKVRSGNFAVSDLRGGSFTVSNLGAIGGQYSTPIVNVPEVAILLVGRSRKLPVVMPDDSIQPRLMMPLSLSYDHRLVDGGTAARFLNDVIGFLEAPSRLLLAL